MDTMDILTDMGMDITVDKHQNNQNAKIGLERTPELSSNYYQINATSICSQDQRMSK